MPRGAVFGFLGPNGSGKTTTIRMLLGLLRATRGESRVLGAPMPRSLDAVLPRVGRARRGTGVLAVPHGRAEPAPLRRRRPALVRPHARRRASAEALDRVGLTHAAKKKAHAYSLGMKQRLGLANALLMPRELLVLDEPTNGLDPQGTREVRALIRSFAADGTTVFVSSHLLAEVEQLCTHVGVMSGGRLVAQGTLDEFRRARCACARAGPHARPRRGRGRVLASLGSRRRTARDAASDLDIVTGVMADDAAPEADRRGARGGGRARARLRGGRREPRAALRRAHRRGLRCHRLRSSRRGSADRRRGGSGTLQLLGNELSTQFRRWRTWAMLAALALIPILHRHRDPARWAGRTRAAAPRSSTRSPNNGLFVGLAAMTVAIPLFLPLTVSVAAGDAIAGEASHGTLRYLLIAPAGRVRLLLVKYLGAAAFCIVGTLTVVVVGTLVGSGCSSRSDRSRCSRARR